MIVVDTNVVSELERPLPDACVVHWLRCSDLSQLYLCAPVLMEMSYGAERAYLRSGTDRLLKSLERLVERTFAGRIIAYDRDAGLQTGRLRAKREKAGRPIDILDAMIAATCLVHGATLATRNVRDFDGLDLKLVNPFEAVA